MTGSPAYAEALDGGQLSPTSWTCEIWFRDDSLGYNHGRRRILSKGDITSSEVPYFASIGSNVLTVGLRSGGSASVVTFNLVSGGITPNAWHHLAASFNGSTRMLTIYIDGVQRAQGTLAFTSAGNALPLIVGRSGTGGDYWRGRLDELRLWSVARTAAEIQASYQSEIGTTPPGLVGNWHFNAGSGTTAVDSAGTPQNLNLLGGAGWSTDVPPPLVGP